MPDTSSSSREVANAEQSFLEALARMERAILEDVRQRSPAGMTGTAGATEALQSLEERIGELQTVLKQTGERAEWQQEQALVLMTTEVRGLRNDLHSFIRLMAAAVVTLVVVLALVVLLRLS